ncbi:hypothetical protein QL285_077223 [Trifolium repens]|nr:hypothetical protein QL285_077223 [Trifolium repens]
MGFLLRTTGVPFPGRRSFFLDQPFSVCSEVWWFPSDLVVRPTSGSFLVRGGGARWRHLVVAFTSSAIKPPSLGSLLPGRRKVRGGCGRFVRWSLAVCAVGLAWWQFLLGGFGFSPVVFCFVGCRLFAAGGLWFLWFPTSVVFVQRLGGFRRRPFPVVVITVWFCVSKTRKGLVP